MLDDWYAAFVKFGGVPGELGRNDGSLETELKQQIGLLTHEKALRLLKQNTVMADNDIPLIYVLI